MREGAERVSGFTFKGLLTFIFLFLSAVVFIRPSHALDDLGSIHLSGKVKALEGRIALVGDRLSVVEPALIQVVREISLGHETEEIAFDEAGGVV